MVMMIRIGFQSVSPMLMKMETGVSLHLLVESEQVPLLVFMMILKLSKPSKVENIRVL